MYFNNGSPRIYYALQGHAYGISFAIRGLLVVWLMSQFDHTVQDAMRYFSYFCILSYALSPVAGYAHDLGLRAPMLIGISLALNCLGLLAIIGSSHAFVFWGLTCLSSSFGIELPAIAILIKTTYPHQSKRCFNGLFFATNIGVLMGLLFCGVCSTYLSYDILFKILLMINTCFLCIFLKYLSQGGHHVLTIRCLMCLVLAVGGVALMTCLIFYHHFLGVVIALSVLFVMVRLFQLKTQMVRTIWMRLLLIFTSVLVFDILFDQLCSSLNFFFETQVKRDVWGFPIPATWLIALNPLYIILCYILFKDLTPRSVYHGMALGLGCLACGCVLMAVGFQQQWFNTVWALPMVCFMMCLYSIGEMWLMPTCQAHVADSIDEAHTGIVMGTWYALRLLSNYLAGIAAVIMVDCLSGSDAAPLSFVGLNMIYGMVLSVLALGILSRKAVSTSG